MLICKYKRYNKQFIEMPLIIFLYAFLKNPIDSYKKQRRNLFNNFDFNNNVILVLFILNVESIEH